jgi:NAD+ kinase
MKIGIIPNTSKKNIINVLDEICKKLNHVDLDYRISNTLETVFSDLPEVRIRKNLAPHDELFKHSDIILSIGGDGTMLTTAYEARNYDTPMIGINLGKLGFMAEHDMQNIDVMIQDIIENNYIIEERMALEATCNGDEESILFAINDIVIDKGRWPKMIELTIKVDDDYVSTFSADGIIVATPTGSTGYSLSTGGPIVSPTINAVTLSPISPHTLTMRPLVLSGNQRISITFKSQHSTVQVNSDGQRVHYYDTPQTIDIYKRKNPIKLIHTKSTNYFEILRNKLYWGLDIRNSSKGEE